MLLIDVLQADWHAPVIVDWGAVHGVDDAANGLDQESGARLDALEYFGMPLKRAVLDGAIPIARIDDMVHRILRSMFAIGIVDHPPVKQDIDYAAHGKLALDIARKGIVLLKNDGDLLPLAQDGKQIAIIGGYANAGVLSGGGSAQVLPSNGAFIRIPIGGATPNWLEVRCSILGAARRDSVHRAAKHRSLRCRCVPGARRGAGGEARTSPSSSSRVTNRKGSTSRISTCPTGKMRSSRRWRASTHIPSWCSKPAIRRQCRGSIRSRWWWPPGIPVKKADTPLPTCCFGKVNPSGRLPITFPRAGVGFAAAHSAQSRQRPEGGGAYRLHRGPGRRLSLVQRAWGKSAVSAWVRTVLQPLRLRQPAGIGRQEFDRAVRGAKHRQLVKGADIPSGLLNVGHG